MSNSNKAHLILFMVAIIWGLTFPLIYDAVKYVSPDLFVFVRFFLSAVIFAPFIYSAFKRTSKQLLWASLILGIYNAVGYLSQTIGLRLIHPPRAAFITSLYVVIVPMIAPLFRLGRLRFIEVLSAVISLLGLYILTGADLSHVSHGDLWVLLCAIAISLQIVYIQQIGTKTKEYGLMSFYQILFTSLPIVVLIHHAPLLPLLNIHVVIAIVFCAIFATCIVFYWQMKYQQYTTPAKAALIYCLEPVFAVFFSWWIDHDTVTRHTIIGGAVMLVAMIIPIVFDLLKERDHQQLSS